MWAGVLALVVGSVQLVVGSPEPQEEQGESSYESFSESYPYSDIISNEVGYCYKRLINDSSCCLDETHQTGVAKRTLHRPGTEWYCDEKKCLDRKKGSRGDDTLWLPLGASCSSPRLLWIHGGSWEYGSPETLSYGQLCSKLAEKTGAIVMVPDYPLAPIGNFTSIMAAALNALQWLAEAPLSADPFFLPGQCSPSRAPIFVGGDSSGGGTALSLILKLKILGGWSSSGITDSSTYPLPNGQQLAGAVLFSPWTNLRCDTPDYYYNAFSKIVATKSKRTKDEDTAVYVGDLMFRGKPKQNLDEFTANAKFYIANHTESLTDPIASPFYAGQDVLGGGGIPPLYFIVGGSESILGDSLIVAQKAAFYGVEVHLDVNVGMWHDFPMYSEGCGSGTPLWQAQRALNRTGDFIQHMARMKQYADMVGLLWPPASSRPQHAHTSYIYDLTRKDTHLWFPDVIISDHTFHLGQASLVQGMVAPPEFWLRSWMQPLAWMAVGALNLIVVQSLWQRLWSVWKRRAQSTALTTPLLPEGAGGIL